MIEVRGRQVAVTLFAGLSRPESHLAIVHHTFRQARWGIAEDKIQLGWQLHLLRLWVSAEEEGALFVPEVKRSGLLQDITAQRLDGRHHGVMPREAVKKMVSRLTHAAVVAPKAKPIFSHYTA